MKLNLTEENVNQILSDIVVGDIYSLRSEIWDLQKQIAYNPEYQSPDSFIQRDLEYCIRSLQALMTVAEYYGLRIDLPESEDNQW